MSAETLVRVESVEAESESCFLLANLLNEILYLVPSKEMLPKIEYKTDNYHDAYYMMLLLYDVILYDNVYYIMLFIQ